MPNPTKQQLTNFIAALQSVFSSGDAMTDLKMPDMGAPAKMLTSSRYFKGVRELARSSDEDAETAKKLEEYMKKAGELLKQCTQNPDQLNPDAFAEALKALGDGPSLLKDAEMTFGGDLKLKNGEVKLLSGIGKAFDMLKKDPQVFDKSEEVQKCSEEIQKETEANRRFFAETCLDDASWLLSESARLNERLRRGPVKGVKKEEPVQQKEEEKKPENLPQPEEKNKEIPQPEVKPEEVKNEPKKPEPGEASNEPKPLEPGVVNINEPMPEQQPQQKKTTPKPKKQAAILGADDVREALLQRYFKLVGIDKADGLELQDMIRGMNYDSSEAGDKWRDFRRASESVLAQQHLTGTQLEHFLDSHQGREFMHRYAFELSQLAKNTREMKLDDRRTVQNLFRNNPRLDKNLVMQMESSQKEKELGKLKNNLLDELDPSVPVRKLPRSQRKGLTFGEATGERFRKCAEMLEKAKNFSNSSEYRDLIKALKNFSKPGDVEKNFPGVPESQQYAMKLMAIGQQVDSYLYHKAINGVNEKDYRKLYAVEQLSKVLSTEMKSLNLAPFKPDKFSDVIFDPQSLKMSFEDRARDVYLRKGDHLPGKAKLDKCFETAKAKNPALLHEEREVMGDVDNCMRKIQLCAVDMNLPDQQRAQLYMQRKGLLENPKPILQREKTNEIKPFGPNIQKPKKQANISI